MCRLYMPAVEVYGPGPGLISYMESAREDKNPCVCVSDDERRRTESGETGDVEHEGTPNCEDVVLCMLVYDALGCPFSCC